MHEDSLFNGIAACLGPYRCVRDIMSSWQCLDAEQHLQLSLQEEELEAYANPDYGQDPRILKPQDVANTLLHSYSVALQACPCGCRYAAFSENSLIDKGLRGYYVESKGNSLLTKE